MGSTEHRPQWTLLIGLAFVLAIVACLVVLMKQAPSKETASEALPVIGPVADFALTNQNDQPVTLADLKGRVWVADIIFTRCAGPCPIMTRKMKELQEALPDDSRARLVTLTTDADYDTPEVLRKYAEKFGADTNRWMFLTGDKVDIARLAQESLKLSAVRKPAGTSTDPNDLFVHSTIFVVVDKQGNLRGAFESTSDYVPWAQVKEELLTTVRELERES